MKIFLAILLFPFVANATNYYVSSAGNDGNIGTTTSVPWKTIARVNTYSINIGFQPGDSILFNGGDTIYGKLRPQNPSIHFGSYGTGKAIISGFTTVSMTSIGGNLYTGTLSGGLPYENTVLVNGVIRGKGRYPDSTYLTYNPVLSDYYQLATSLSGTPDFTGAEIVERNYCYITDVRRQTSQTVGAIKRGNIVGGSSYPNGTYNNVPLTGGTGTGALAQIIVSGGTVTTVTVNLSSLGSAFLVNDVLSASNTNLGGAGSGFTFTITEITTLLNVRVGFTYPPPATEYFYENLPQFCDHEGDWSIDSATNLITVYSALGMPIVQGSTIDTIVYAKKKDNLSFDNLNIIGPNATGIYSDSCNNMTIRNCTGNYIGGANNNPVIRNGLSGAFVYGDCSRRMLVTHDSILNSLNDGIFIIHNSDSTVVSYNYLHNTGVLNGMSGSSNGAGCGIFVANKYDTINNNRVINTGYDGIYWADHGTGKNNYVHKNFVDTFCTNKDDGGGIYCGEPRGQGALVDHNIVRHGIGTGCNSAPCLYLDGNTDSCTFSNNTLESGRNYTVFMAHPYYVNLLDNTILGSSMAAIFHNSGGAAHDDTIMRNVIYVADSIAANVELYYGDLQTRGWMDYNYILRPLKDTANFWFRQTSFVPEYSMSQWTALNGYEAHSHRTPTTIKTRVGVLVFNDTEHDSTYTFTGRKITAKGVVCDRSVVIHPFESEVLFDGYSPEHRQIGSLKFD